MTIGNSILSRIQTVVLIFLFHLVFLGFTATPGRAADSFNLILSYTDVAVGPDQDFEMDAEVVNRTKDPVHIALSTQSVPDGWTVSFNSRYPSFPVRAVMVQGEKSNTLEFKAKIPKETKPGTYTVGVSAKDLNGSTTQTDEITFRIGSKKVETGGLKLESQYPELSGPSNQTFKFTIDLKNETDKPLTTALAAQAPPGWRVRVKPQFEETQISSIALKKDSSETLSVEIDPPALAEPGDYPLTIRARSGSFEAEASLKINLTGTFDLKMGTQTGVLNTSATAGEKSQVVFLVGNGGTGSLRNLSFLSRKPDKWNVDFKPEKIDALKPGEVQEVKVEILPPKRSIAGDYLLTVTSNSPDTNKSLDFRVTVSTPTLWGWIGAIIVLAVVLGLGLVFARLGRR